MEIIPRDGGVLSCGAGSSDGDGAASRSAMAQVLLQVEPQLASFIRAPTVCEMGVLGIECLRANAAIL
jgi:hypothetical protein